MSDFLVSKTEKATKDRVVLEKLCRKPLTDQEAFNAEQDLIGAFAWLFEMDRKYNPQFYDDNGD